MDTPRPSPRTNRTRRVPHPAGRVNGSNYVVMSDGWGLLERREEGGKGGSGGAGCASGLYGAGERCASGLYGAGERCASGLYGAGRGGGGGLPADHAALGVVQPLRRGSLGRRARALQRKRARARLARLRRQLCGRRALFAPHRVVLRRRTRSRSAPPLPPCASDAAHPRVKGRGVSA